jgi:hypothetical protein
MTCRSAAPDRPGAGSLLARALALALGAVAVLGCSAMLEREHDQCRTSEDCQHFGVGAVCTTNGTCQRAMMTAEKAPDSSLPRCERDADCNASSVCRDAACHDLKRSGCAMLSAPGFDSEAERLPLLLLLPDAVRDAKRIGSAVQTAVNAWSAARLLGPELPELSVVACAASDLGAVDLLDEGGIRSVIAAVKTAQLESVLQAVDGRALVFAPFAEAPGLRELIESRRTSSVVSCKPNRADGTAWMSSAISAVSSTLERAGRTAASAGAIVALNEDEVRYGYDVLLEGTSFASVAYSGDRISSALTREAKTPGLIVGISGEADWSLNIAAIEGSSLGHAQPPPFYLLMDRQAGVRDLVVHDDLAVNTTFTGGNDWKRLGDRVLLWDGAATDRNREVHDRFEALLPPGEALGADLDYVHDCLYVALYASMAGQIRFAFSSSRLSVEAVLVGLRALVGGEPLPIGSTHLVEGQARLVAALADDSVLDLIGGSGDLDFVDLPSTEDAVLSPTSRYLAPAIGESELYCIDAKQGHCPTGVTVSMSGSLIGESECPCFNLN